MLVQGGRIIVRAARTPKKVRIEDLVAKMPRGYRPLEDGFGPVKGKELC